ncbi:LAME_0F00298g1_1 [Lachancea meyersii CBS 8951]|uniref:LAME_0F00298g1_1 n=1 Tax=Lachancea meyersii CBS 8951 TaxID=1266667 RepID=A0A1G4JP57_9SACH|nr:LAME_0F00298g1_1 [Lachancea meyersii CBS 8951]
MSNIVADQEMGKPPKTFKNYWLFIILRVVQTCSAAAILGLLGYSQEKDFDTFVFELTVATVSVLYSVIVACFRVPVDLRATILCIFEIIMTGLWLAVAIVLGTKSGTYNCKWQKDSFTSDYSGYYYSYSYNAVKPCRTAQAGIGLAAFNTVLFAISLLLIGKKAFSELKRVSVTAQIVETRTQVPENVAGVSEGAAGQTDVADPSSGSVQQPVVVA